MANFLASLPLIGGLFDDSEDKAFEQIQKMADIYKNPAYQADYLGGYVPQERQASLLKEDGGMKAKQMDYLQKLMGLSEQGLSPEDEAVFARAKAQANQQAAAQNQTILNQMRERGIGDSGAALAMRQQATQDAIGRQAQANMDQAAASSRQKALYTQAYGSALGDVRNQDYRTQAANQDAINKFNAAGMQAQNQAAMLNQQARQQHENQRAQQALQGALAPVEAYQNWYLGQGTKNKQARQALGGLVGMGIGAMAAPAGAGGAGAQIGQNIGSNIGGGF